MSDLVLGRIKSISQRSSDKTLKTFYPWCQSKSPRNKKRSVGCYDIPWTSLFSPRLGPTLWTSSRPPRTGSRPQGRSWMVRTHHLVELHPDHEREEQSGSDDL